MKLIDEKGKLFGKVNLIDLVVVMLILFLVVAVGYKVLGPKITTSPAAQGEVTAIVKFTFRSDNMVKAVQKGQKLVFGTDYIADAFITDVTSNFADYTSSDAQGKVHYEKHPVLKDMYVTIKAKINTNVPILKIGTQELAQGKKFILKTQTIEMEGNVDSITIK
ncbi:MAG TPA: DUF4330 domain-containing protein [Ruminiclostridium sp.]